MIENLLLMFKGVLGNVPVADLFNGDPASAAVKLKHYQAAYFLLQKGAGATGTATLTVQACTLADGTGAEAVEFNYIVCTATDVFSAIARATTAGFATTAGANQMYFIHVDSRDLPADKPWVRLKMTEVANDPITGSVLVLCGKPTYLQDPLPTAL